MECHSKGIPAPLRVVIIQILAYLCPVIYSSIIKPFFDYLCAFIALVVTLPMIVALGVILLFINRGSPFFSQVRSGKGDELFRIYKFKSMTDRKDSEGHLLSDAERLTTFGKLIRKTSLDELPQLWNILKGDMSFIGPRPLPAMYLPLYSRAHAVRNQVKPGISGWAQVNGRNAISWNTKFDLDVWYVEHLSFLVDVRILLKTVVIVFTSEGVNTEGQATTVPYNGKN